MPESDYLPNTAPHEDLESFPAILLTFVQCRAATEPVTGRYPDFAQVDRGIFVAGQTGVADPSVS